MKRIERRIAGALLLILTACGERDEPLVPEEPSAPSGLATTLLLAHGPAIQCAGSTSSGGSLQCGGGDGTVDLIVSGASYDHGTAILSFTARVRNRIPQPIGTADASTVSGIEAFFATDPVVTSGTGSVSVANPDGIGTFTAGNQSYFLYNTVLQPNEVSAPRIWQLAVDPTVTSFAFTVSLEAAVPYPGGWIDVTPESTFVAVGGTRQLTAVARTALGAVDTAAALTWSSSSSSASVDPQGLVTGISSGNTTIEVSDGTRMGQAGMRVCSPWTTQIVGASLFSSGTSFCLSGYSTGAEYTLVLGNRLATDISLTVRGTGIVPVFGPPSPTRLPGSGKARLSGTRRPLPDDAWETRLRTRERRELTSRLAALPRSAKRTADPRRRSSIVPGVPLPGDRMTLNVETGNSCSTQDLHTGEVKVVGAHVIVVVDTANPTGGLSGADYQEIAALFDTLVRPVMFANFPTPNDVDLNGRVIVFYTRVVNELAAPGGAHIPGFVLTRDHFLASACPTSNQGEIIYMMAADPTGTINGNARSVAFVKDLAAVTLAHEMQHLGNASIRVEGTYTTGFEEVWLDEGLSGIAEEQLFYWATKLPRGQNLGVAELIASPATTEAFFAYVEPNFSRLRRWLQAPETSGFFQSDNDAATRGATWGYLRYVAHFKNDHETKLWLALGGNDYMTGMGALWTATSTHPLDIGRRFIVATYTDDAGLGVPVEYTQSSWNFRSIYGALDYDNDGFGDGYPLAVHNPADGVSDVITLTGGGGAAYLRLGVPANGVALVTITPDATRNEQANYAIIRRR